MTCDSVFGLAAQNELDARLESPHKHGKACLYAKAIIQASARSGSFPIFTGPIGGSASRDSRDKHDHFDLDGGRPRSHLLLFEAWRIQVADYIF